MCFSTLCNSANSDVDNQIRYVDQYQALLTRRDSYIDEEDFYEADLSFYRANLQICEAVSADGPVDRPEPQSPVDDRQRIAEDAAYVLPPERMRPNRAPTMEIGN